MKNELEAETAPEGAKAVSVIGLAVYEEARKGRRVPMEMPVRRYVVHCGKLGSFAIDAFTRAHAIAICVHSFTKSCYEFHPADVLKWRVEQEVGEDGRKD